MCKDLFNLLVESGGPDQKTIIFCAKDNHADRVATEMNNLYREWRAANGLKALVALTSSRVQPVQHGAMFVISLWS